MTDKLFDTTSREGRLLYVAIATLKTSGPPELREMDTAEIVAGLEQVATTLENFRM